MYVHAKLVIYCWSYGPNIWKHNCGCITFRYNWDVLRMREMIDHRATKRSSLVYVSSVFVHFNSPIISLIKSICMYRNTY